MAQPAMSDLQTKTAPALKNHIYTMAAAFAGVIFGVLGSMGFVGNYLNSQFAAQTAALDKRLVAVAPASANSSDACYGTSTASTSGAAAHKTTPAHEVATAMPAGGRGGDDGQVTPGKPSTPAPFVQQLISGSINNTGPNSSNSINASNTVNYSQTNNNNVTTSTNNNQSATSGSANSSVNTTGGAANSGDSMNHNSSSTSVNIQN